MPAEEPGTGEDPFGGGGGLQDLWFRKRAETPEQ